MSLRTEILDVVENGLYDDCDKCVTYSYKHGLYPEHCSECLNKRRKISSLGRAILEFIKEEQV